MRLLRLSPARSGLVNGSRFTVSIDQRFQVAGAVECRIVRLASELCVSMRLEVMSHEVLVYIL